MATPKTPADLGATLIIESFRDAVETIRDIQVDGEQCHPDPDYRNGWIAACEKILDGLKET